MKILQLSVVEYADAKNKYSLNIYQTLNKFNSNSAAAAEKFARPLKSLSLENFILAEKVRSFHFLHRESEKVSTGEVWKSGKFIRGNNLHRFRIRRLKNFTNVRKMSTGKMFRARKVLVGSLNKVYRLQIFFVAKVVKICERVNSFEKMMVDLLFRLQKFSKFGDEYQVVDGCVKVAAVGQDDLIRILCPRYPLCRPRILVN